jgi:hypothetical protein
MAMAGAAAVDAESGARPRAGLSTLPLVLLIWALFALASGVSSFPNAIGLMSTDDSMRLVEVRDLLAGQGWYDLLQRRLDPPAGIVMHWSRLIDLPIAVILTLSGAVLAPDAALKLTLTLWPELLLLPTLLAGASIGRTLGGASAGIVTALLLALAPGVTGRFTAGMIDHHGAQIALTLTMLACALRLERSVGAAIGAGLAAASMLAIGMETLPHLAICAALVALRWAFTGEGMARGAAIFGLSLAAATLGVAAATIPAARWGAPVCDALGIAHVLAGTIGGVGLAFATRLKAVGPAGRLGALAAIGAAVLGAVVLVSPECLSSPYAGVPERLRSVWLDGVQEARGFIAFATQEPSSALVIGLPLGAMAMAAGWTFMTTPRGAGWRAGVAVALFATACAVTLWQVRGASLAYALGAPFLACVIAALAGGDRVRGVLAVMLLNPMTLSLAGLGVAHAVGLPAPDRADPSCPVSDYRALGRLPTGLALNTIDTGPSILVFSPHAVIAAPYHRNIDGIAAEINAFMGGEEAARAVALSRGAAYVVACPVDGGVRRYAELEPDSFSGLLQSGRAPSWLEPIDLGPDAKLKTWRVLPGR